MKRITNWKIKIPTTKTILKYTAISTVLGTLFISIATLNPDFDDHYKNYKHNNEDRI